LIERYYNFRRWLALWTTPQMPETHWLSPDDTKILFVATGLMGDTIMSIPAIMAFRENYPDAHITVLVNSKSQELLSMVSAIDDFMVCDHSPFPLNPSKIFKTSELRQKIRRRKFDIAIILLGDDFVPMLTRAGIPIRVGVKENIFELILTHSYSIGSPRTWGPEERLGAVNSLGLLTKSVSSYFEERPIKPSTRVRSEAHTKLKNVGYNLRDPLVVFHPFGRSSHQWLPSELAEQVMEAIKTKLEMQFVIVGDIEQRKFAISAPSLVGKLTIPELAAVMKRAKLVISTDSGPMHLAGALGVPTIGIFRRMRKEHVNRYPGVVKGIWSKNPYICSKRKGCNWNRCRVLPCEQLKVVSVDKIIELASDLLRP